VITTEVVPDDMAFIVYVRASKPIAAKDWQKIFDDLDRAMDEIEAKVTDHDTYYFQIRLRVDGFNFPIASSVPRRTGKMSAVRTIHGMATARTFGARPLQTLRHGHGLNGGSHGMRKH
jgi:hypothetical protein